MQPFDFILTSKAASSTSQSESGVFVLEVTLYPHSPPFQDLEFEWLVFDQISSTPLEKNTFVYKSTKAKQDFSVRKASFGLTKAYQAVKKLRAQCEAEGRVEDIMVTIRVKLAKEKNYAKPGLVLGEQNFNATAIDKELQEAAAISKAVSKNLPEEEVVQKGEVKVLKSAELYHLKGETYTATFNVKEGKLMVFHSGDDHNATSLLEPNTGMSYRFYRAPTDNDRGGTDNLLDNFATKVGRKFTADLTSLDYFWRAYGLDDLKSEVVGCRVFAESNQQSTELLPESAVSSDQPFWKLRFIVKERHLDFNSKNGSKTKGKVRFTTFTEYVFVPSRLVLNCEVEASKALQENLPSLSRVGSQFVLPSSFKSCAYLGRGPHETYPDRKATARYGVHSCKPEDFHVGYIRPSESGGRADVQWVQFTDGEPSPTGKVKIYYSQTENEVQTPNKREQRLRGQNQSQAFFSNFNHLFKDLTSCDLSDPEELNVTHHREIYPGLTKMPISPVANATSGEGTSNQKEKKGVESLAKVVPNDVLFKGTKTHRPAGMLGCQMNVSKYSVEQLARASHQFELEVTPVAGEQQKAEGATFGSFALADGQGTMFEEERDVVATHASERVTYLIMDTAHVGLGGDTSWMPHLHEQYRFNGRFWRYSIVFEVPEEKLAPSSIELLGMTAKNISETMRSSINSFMRGNQVGASTGANVKVVQKEVSLNKPFRKGSNRLGDNKPSSMLTRVMSLKSLTTSAKNKQSKNKKKPGL